MNAVSNRRRGSSPAEEVLGSFGSFGVPSPPLRGAEPLVQISGTSYLAVVVYELKRCQAAIPLTYTAKIRYPSVKLGSPLRLVSVFAVLDDPLGQLPG